VSTAQPATTGVTVPATGHYRVDPDRSSIVIHTKHLFGLGTVRGTFTLRTGDILVTDPVTTSTIHAVADAASFTSGNTGRDKQVRSKALLHADEHTDIRFSADTVSATDGSWTVHGTLTARGGSAPLDLTIVEATDRAETLTIVATSSIDRYMHGITGLKGLTGRHLDVIITAIAHRTT
jgi:polyisoprenoid-binding protein YceI